MSKPDDGTSEFKVASLRDLLEGEESAKPAKGGGGGGNRNRQVAMIGGAAGVVALILMVVLVAGGNGGGETTDADLFPVGFEIRSTKVAQVEKGDRISVCSPGGGPLAQDIEVKGKSVDKTAIGGFATVQVEATEEEAGKLSSVPDDTEVYEKDRCPRFTSTAPSTSPATEPTPATGPADTTPATTPPG